MLAGTLRASAAGGSARSVDTRSSRLDLNPVVGHTRFTAAGARPIGRRRELRAAGARKALMERRKLVVTAGALSATAFAATLAIGASFGLVNNAQPDSPVGRLDDRKAAAGATPTVHGDGTNGVADPVRTEATRLGPNADD